MITTYSNATSAKMVVDAYHSLANVNKLRKEHGIKNENELTVEGICNFMAEKKVDLQFSIPRLAAFFKEEKVGDQKLRDAVAKRIFVAQSLRIAQLPTDRAFAYGTKQIDGEIVDLVVRFLHGKTNLTSRQISDALNIGDQKSYAVTSKWDAEVASRKKIKRGEDIRPNVFAPISDATNREILRLIDQGRDGDRAIAEETGVSVATVQERRSAKNMRETARIMEKARAKTQTEETGPSEVFGIAMFKRED